jgi:cytoskeletal protein RodZ
VPPNGPSDDFNNQPTRHSNVPGRPEIPPPPAEEPEPSLDPFGEETEPTEWYRRPVVLIGWAVLVLILIALIVYGILQLTQEQGTSNPPSTSTTTTTPATTTTTTTTTTSEPTTTTTTPATTSAAEPPPQQPTHTQQQQPAPTHRHHWPTWLPSQLPPGWF